MFCYPTNIRFELPDESIFGKKKTTKDCYFDEIPRKCTSIFLYFRIRINKRFSSFFAHFFTCRTNRIVWSYFIRPTRPCIFLRLYIYFSKVQLELVVSDGIRTVYIILENTYVYQGFYLIFGIFCQCPYISYVIYHYSGQSNSADTFHRRYLCLGWILSTRFTTIYLSFSLGIKNFRIKNNHERREEKNIRNIAQVPVLRGEENSPFDFFSICYFLFGYDIFDGWVRIW